MTNQVGYKIYKRETVRGEECELIMWGTSPLNAPWDHIWIERISSFILAYGSVNPKAGSQVDNLAHLMDTFRMLSFFYSCQVHTSSSRQPHIKNLAKTSESYMLYHCLFSLCFCILTIDFLSVCGIVSRFCCSKTLHNPSICYAPVRYAANLCTEWSSASRRKEQKKFWWNPAIFRLWVQWNLRQN